MSLNTVFFTLLLTSSMSLKFIFKPRDSKKIHPAKESLSDTELLRNVPTEVSSWRHELAKLSNLREEGSSFLEGPKTKSLAVFVTGLQHRLLTSSKIKHVIQSAAKQGYDVDVYMSIVRSNASLTFEKQSGSVTDNSVATQDATDEATLRSALSGVAQLAFYELLDHQEEVSLEELPNNRLTQYRKNPALGLNVLRRFFANEKLFNRTTASGSKYDFVLVTRDDDHWLGPLNLTEFSSKPNASRTLFTKGCRQWGGVNDKTLLFGYEAAQAVLGTVYTDFFDPAPNLKTDNAEQFLMNFAKNKGIELEGVPFGSIPTADSVYIQTNHGPAHLCTKTFYLCPGLPKSPEYDQPTTCPKTKHHRSLKKENTVAVTETSSLPLNHDVPVSAQSSNPFDSVVFAGLTKSRKGGYANIEKLTDFCWENGCKVLIGSPEKVQRKMTKTPKLALAVSSEILFLDSDSGEGNTNGKNSRTTKLSHLRNNLFAKLRTEPLLNRANNIAIVDLDGVIQFDNATLSAVKKALKLPGWDGLSFYSEHYYDLWALRCTAETPNCYQRNSYSACTDKTKHDWSCLSKAKALGDSSMLEIASAFNGINLYKATAVEDCLYDGTDETNGMDCEHVAFNKCISAKGKRFVMTGPDIQIQTKWEGGSYTFTRSPNGCEVIPGYGSICPESDLQ